MYYYAKNNKKFGPVSIEELKTVGITKSTLIWTEGYPDWVEAEKITELEDVLKAIPPPLPKTYNSGKSIYPKDKGLFIIGLILFFLPGIFKITIDERDLFNILSKAFLISRLIIPFFTYSIAKKKEKNKLAWMFLGLVFPSISIIILSYYKTNIKAHYDDIHSYKYINSLKNKLKYNLQWHKNDKIDKNIEDILSNEWKQFDIDLERSTLNFNQKKEYDKALQEFEEIKNLKLRKDEEGSDTLDIFEIKKIFKG